MFSRFVALGDSSTEGLDDPDGAGGYRGWADRLAEHAARAYPGLTYANLAVRGRSAHEIKATELEPALAMRPDLATVVAGMNDLLRRNWSAVRVAAEIGEMVHALTAIGATVVMFTIPDVSRRMRLGRTMSARTAELNVELRKIAVAENAVLLDLARREHAHDPRLWAVDRLHGNAAGHERIANELARQLGIPGVAAFGLEAPLEPSPARAKHHVLIEDLAWIAKFVAPWAWRRLRGRTLGDGRSPKRPNLTPVL
ncbi:SGNH/GDSL hydrolase family protein [soil metagenome]